MSGACRAYGGDQGLIQGFDGEVWGEEITLETQA